jgi:hypothetical protein
MRRMSRGECGRGPRPDAAEEEAAVEGESASRERDGNPIANSPASRGRVGRAAFRFLYAGGFCGKRDRQKLGQKLGVWPRLQLLAARICPESQPNGTLDHSFS